MVFRPRLDGREFARLRPFANSIDVHYRTTQRYVRAGMPVLRGHRCAVIVHIPTAIEWLKARRQNRRGRPRNLDRANSKD
jgi:hypothetical protein